MKKISGKVRRKRMLAVNTLLILAIVLIIWAFAGFDAVGRKGAFKRALMEAMLPAMEPEIYTNTDGRVSALAEKDGVVYQAVIYKDRWFFWDNSPMVSRTEKSGDIYVVPLRAYGDLHDAPEVAVKAEGVRAELAIQLFEGGLEHPLILTEARDGWFLFCYDRADRDYESLNGEFDLFCGEQAYEYLLRSPVYTSPFGIYSEPYGTAEFHGRFIFRSFDESGDTVCEGERIF